MCGFASSNLLLGEGGVQEERLGQGEGEGQGTRLHPWHGILPILPDAKCLHWTSDLFHHQVIPMGVLLYIALSISCR